MITFKPIDAVLQEASYSAPTRYYAAEEWLLILAWVANEHQGKPWQSRGEWEVLNDTSGNGCTSLDGCEASVAGRDARKRLAKLFVHAGRDNSAGLLLWRLGIRTLPDLETAVSIPGRAPKWGLAWWGKQEGRMFKQPGPNPSHPAARWVTHCTVRYSVHRRTWGAFFFYDYPRDGGSSWNEGVSQKRGESLDKFGARVDAFIRDRFEPEGRNGPLWRPSTEGKWREVNKAMRSLFPWGRNVPPDYAKQIADILCRASSGRFELSPSRLGVLKRWAREAVALHPYDEPGALEAVVPGESGDSRSRGRGE